MNWEQIITIVVINIIFMIFGFWMGILRARSEGWKIGFDVGRMSNATDSHAVSLFIKEIRVLLEVDVEEAKKRIDAWGEFEKKRKEMMDKVGSGVYR